MGIGEEPEKQAMANDRQFQRTKERNLSLQRKRRVLEGAGLKEVHHRKGKVQSG